MNDAVQIASALLEDDEPPVPQPVGHVVVRGDHYYVMSKGQKRPGQRWTRARERATRFSREDAETVAGMYPKGVAAIIPVHESGEEDRAESDPPYKPEPPQPEDFDPKELVMRYADDINKGTIDRRSIDRLGYGRHLYHRQYLRKDGDPFRVKINGAIKTWVTRPEEFKIPWKYGLRRYGYITHLNADAWSTVPPAGFTKKQMRERFERLPHHWDDRRYP